MIDLPLTTGLILNRTLALLRGNAARVVIAMVVMTVPAVALDLGRIGSGLWFVVSVATLIMQYWLTVSLLRDSGLRETASSRFPAFFLLEIATNLAVIVGLILLIVPGLFLLVRWSIAVPAVIAADQRVFDAMRYSWRETEAHFWPIFAAFLIIYALAAAGVGIGYMLELRDLPELGVTIFELSINAGLIAGWLAANAIYAKTRRESRFSEVFA